MKRIVLSILLLGIIGISTDIQSMYPDTAPRSYKAPSKKKSAKFGKYKYKGKYKGRRKKSPQELDLRLKMRELWTDHGVWTRQYIVDAAADLESLQPTTERLLKNQEDIGAAIVPFYGKEAGTQLTQLLKDHILIAGDLVTAAKKGDQNAAQAADTKWHKNADDIAAFLAKANPNWQEKEMRDMLYDHLKLVKEEAVSRLQRNWNKDIVAWDNVRAQADKMADGLSAGIVKQFPEKFGNYGKIKHFFKKKAGYRS